MPSVHSCIEEKEKMKRKIKIKRDGLFARSACLFFIHIFTSDIKEKSGAFKIAILKGQSNKKVDKSIDHCRPYLRTATSF
jgi:hypothetical protein